MKSKTSVRFGKSNVSSSVKRRENFILHVLRSQSFYLFFDFFKINGKKRNENYFKLKSKNLEDPGIDPGTSRMLSGRSTIWANPPFIRILLWFIMCVFSADTSLSVKRVSAGCSDKIIIYIFFWYENNNNNGIKLDVIHFFEKPIHERFTKECHRLFEGLQFLRYAPRF